MQQETLASVAAFGCPLSERFWQAMAGLSMVRWCPFLSVVPGLPADPLVKCRRLWRARGTILFKRLQFPKPLLGRNRNSTHEQEKLKSEKAKQKTFRRCRLGAHQPQAAGVDIGCREHWACVPA